MAGTKKRKVNSNVNRVELKNIEKLKFEIGCDDLHRMSPDKFRRTTAWATVIENGRLNSDHPKSKKLNRKKYEDAYKIAKKWFDDLNAEGHEVTVSSGNIF